MEKPPTDSLADAWEERARSSARDYFVASHKGWSDSRAWETHALADLRTLFAGVTREQLSKSRVLEIGCGVGRLARHHAPSVREYVGFDIAPTMVEEARRRTKEIENVQFFVGRGDEVPSAVEGQFDFIIAHAVFIHLPRTVITANLISAQGRLAPRGQLRFQVRMDPADRGGFGDHTPDVEAPGPFEVPTSLTVVDDIAPLEPLIERLTKSSGGDFHYIGHLFSWDELKQLGAGLGVSRSILVRLDDDFGYALFERPG